MKRTLALLKSMHSHIGRVVGTGSITQYEVTGFPPGEEASIANFGSADQPSWCISRAKDGVGSGWMGDYKTAEDALAVLQKDFDS